jgi:hypothetical protein
MGDEQEQKKRYVVVAPRVMLETMTQSGRALLGFFAGAPVPEDVPEDSIKHHLDNNLIVEVADPGVVGAELNLTPLEVAEMRDSGQNPIDVVADRVREGEKGRNRSRGAQKAAETRKANAEGDDDGGPRDGEQVRPDPAPATVVQPPVSPLNRKTEG